MYKTTIGPKTMPILRFVAPRVEPHIRIRENIKISCKQYKVKINCVQH